jgi:hypothetical protein
MLTTMEEKTNGVLWCPILKGYNWENLFYRSSLQYRFSLPEWHREIPSAVRHLWKVVSVKDLVENCCGRGTWTVWEPRGRRISAVGSCY